MGDVDVRIIDEDFPHVKEVDAKLIVLAKKMNAKLPAAYKFLGKCYMRAGRASEANANYKQYLDLAPNAPDAPFIKSILK